MRAASYRCTPNMASVATFFAGATPSPDAHALGMW
jgi:hypothetical protein